MNSPTASHCVKIAVLAALLLSVHAHAQVPVIASGQDYAWTNLAGVPGGYGSDDGAIANARFGGPKAIAIGPDGTTYVADTSNNIIRKISPDGFVTTLAGSPGVSGSADGTGSAARFFQPGGIAVDGSGNVYVADTENHTVRKITSAGVVTTLAGSAGITGSSDGTGSAARFYSPTGIALDSDGTVYVTDRYNQSIRKITSTGVVTTLAGTATSSGSTDGTGAAARFNYPAGIAMSASGDLYVADANSHTIRKITASGVVTTVAGSATLSGSTNGTGSAARFNQPWGITLDGAGNIYVAEQVHTIRKLTLSGSTWTVTTLAGTSGSFGSTNGTGSAARFNKPSGVAADSSGNIYVADSGNNLLRKVTPAGVVTIHSGSLAQSGSTNGTGAAARFDSPQGIAVDSSGTVYVPDSSNRTIRKVTPGGVVTTFAGKAGTSGLTDGTGTNALFYAPDCVAVDTGGNLYVTDSNTIRTITADGVVTTIAGTSQSGSINGVGTSARFYGPSGVACDADGNLYVADTSNHTIRKLTFSGGTWTVSTLAGTAGQSGGTDGTGSAARFKYPGGVAVDGSGNVYVTDYQNHTIRKITPEGVVTTIAGVAGKTGSTDGLGGVARFNYPMRLAVDSAGAIYVADQINNTIRKIAPSGTDWVVSTIGGKAGITGGADGIGAAATFSWPRGIALDGTGKVYVADSSNNRITVGNNNALAATGYVGTPFSFQTTASNSPTSFDATNLPAGLGVNSATGLISGTPTTSGVFTATLSAANASGTGTAMLALTILNPGQPTITAVSSPGAGGVLTGAGSYASGASATVTATPNSGYTFLNWTESGTQVSTSPSYSFTVSGNRSLTANFQPMLLANAGSDILVSLPTMEANLNGSAIGGTVLWTQISGPGPVTFANPNTATTTAQFPQLGTYVLRLTTTGANAVTVSDDVTVTLVDPTVVAPLEAQTVARLRAWAEQKEGNDPVKGRPLPLAASWAAGAGAFQPTTYSGLPNGDSSTPYFVNDPLSRPTPSRMVQEIRQGRHVMITFEDVLTYPGINRPSSRFDEPGFTARFDEYYRPALEYARTHSLPIAIRGFNWAVTLVDVENGVQGRGRATPQLRPEDIGQLAQFDTAKLIQNGQTGLPVLRDKIADPFGPIHRWVEFGRIWMGHEVMKKIQEIYPNPPMVVFINNHEAGQITETSTQMSRFDELYPGPQTAEFRASKIREGYAERYRRLFDAARDAMVPAWKENSLFIAYNNTAPQILGRGVTDSTVWTRSLKFDATPGPNQGYTEHRVYDGGTPEYYDNHWQAPTKSDSSPWSPQVEASNLIAYQDARVWAENPNFYWSSSLWGGDMPQNLFGRPGRYITDDAEPDAKWDIDRYTGMLQFGLWMLRPREYREFRGEDDLRGFYGLTWNALVQSVDRVWNEPALTEFWKFGKLVHNPVFGKRKHYFGSASSMPQWLQEMDRWFLLTSDANSPESTWPAHNLLTKEHALRVFALALQLGESPNRRWLIYAHAPLGSVAGSRVTVPGLGSVILDYIPRSGSFFTVNEGAATATALLRGGPAEIALSPSARHIVPGGSVTVNAVLKHPPATAITGYTWRVAGEADRARATLTSESYTFATPGEKMITLEVATEGGATVTEQIPIWVRDSPPGPEVVIDMPLRSTYAWTGPWGTDLRSGALQTFRYLPNASTSFLRESVLRGGNIVNDPEEGKVLEVRTDVDGVIMTRSERTILNSEGHSNMAIAFRFKAEDVQRRQLLYSQGADGRPGISIYLQDGKIFAGSWRMSPSGGTNWLGEWIDAPVVANSWYEVRFALADATTVPRAGVASLTLNGKLVRTAAGVRLPAHFSNPRLSVAGLGTSLRTAISANADGVTPGALAGSLLRESDFFVGRIADFTFSSGASLASAQRYVQRAISADEESQPGSTTGIVFEADNVGAGGRLEDLPELIPSESPSDPAIYRSYRIGASFSYSVSVPNGPYNVRLMFLEPHDRSMPRLFNVDLQGNRVLTDFNIQQEAGAPRQAVDRSFPVIVTNGTLSLAFTGVGGTDAVLSGFVIEKQPLATPGLIGHWRFDEKSGATAFDTSGRNRDLKFPNVISWEDGAVFSGSTTPQAATDSNVDAQYSLGTGNKLTASLWVRPVGMAGRSCTILWHGATQADIRLALDNQLRLVAEIDNINPSTPLIATRPLSENRWYHVAVVYDGSLSSPSARLRLYIDGQLNRTGTENSTVLPNRTARFFVGQKNTTTSDPKFTGNLRDLRLITDVLSPADIESIANAAPLGAAADFIHVPYSPEQLTGTANASLTEIHLSWLPVRGAISYNVKRSNTSGGPYALIASGLTTTTYSDTGLIPNQRYYYVVTATTAGGESPNNNEIFRTTQPDITVDNLDVGFTANTSGEWSGTSSVGTFFGTNYRLDSTTGADADTRWARWTPTIPLSGIYQVFMRWPASSDRPVAAPVEIVHANGTDNTQTVNQRINDGIWMPLGHYSFLAGNNTSSGSIRIFATDAGRTAADAVRLVYSPLAAPLGLTATAISPNQIDLNWTDGTDNEDGFAIERSLTGTDGWSQVGTTGANVTNYSSTDLAASTRYFYRVRAFLSNANSTYSNVAEALTLADTPPPDGGGEIIVDNSDVGSVTFSGTWTASTWTGGGSFFGVNYLYAASGGSGLRSATYRPTLAAATYEVFINYTSSDNRASNVPVTINYNGGNQTILVNMRTGGGQWRSLGVFPFSFGTEGNVVIANLATNGFVIADALRFVRVNSTTPPSRLADWRAAHFDSADLSDPAKAAIIWGLHADPDGDGIANLIEYALGQSPTMAQSTGLPTVGVSSGNRTTLSFQRDPSLTDITYAVEASSDLASWTTIATSVAGGAMQNLGGASSITENGTSLKTVTVEDSLVISSSGAGRFLRLRITGP